MFAKKTRIKDRVLLASVRRLPCVACGSWPVDAHHVKSTGAGGDDTEANCMPLCRRCHTEWHQVGPNRMMARYPTVEHWLELAGMKPCKLKIG